MVPSRRGALATAAGVLLLAPLARSYVLGGEQAILNANHVTDKLRGLFPQTKMWCEDPLDVGFIVDTSNTVYQEGDLDEVRTTLAPPVPPNDLILYHSSCRSPPPDPQPLTHTHTRARL